MEFWASTKVKQNYLKNLVFSMPLGGKNVTVAADVRLYEHDLIHRMYNNDQNYCGPKINYYTGKIVVEDNVVIGGRSIIMYNVTIGHHSLIAAGSVVTKNVPPFSIVGGNPAKVIGNTKELLKKRLQYSNADISAFERLYEIGEENYEK